jgi:diadenosine tetraphosphate (Ap4A) HIT family hydrolase
VSCELCDADGGTVLWRDAFLRVVRPAVAGYPGFCRVVLNRHAREMTELAADERERLMHAVFACEGALLALYKPDKVNLASFGNQVPHLHWHVIARFADDAHFPDPIWAAQKRAGRERPAIANAVLTEELVKKLKA